MKRIIIIFLLIATLFVSCGSNAASGTTPTDTTASQTTEKKQSETVSDIITEPTDTVADTVADTVTETTEAPLVAELPELNLNGEKITIMYRASLKNEFWTEGLSGEIVNDAIYERNRSVEELFNCALDYIPNDNTNWNGGYQGVISRSVLAGDETYDIVSGPAYHIISLIPEHLMYDLYEVEHIDFEKPWWNQGLLDTTAIGNRIYFASGDISLGMIKYLHCTFFNKRLVNEYDMGDLYQTVLDGKWTVEKMESLTKDKYSDLNGDGTKDYENDSFGYVINDKYLWRAYIDALDVSLISLNSDKLPELNITNERIYDVYDLFYRWCGTGSSGDIILANGNKTAYSLFTSGRSIFTMGRFVDAETEYRDMKDSFGVLPVPKWDESQDEYHVTICGSESTFGIPSNSSKTEYLGAIMEALAYESYKNVTPVYYESALKLKYTDEAIDAQIIDIIKNGSRFNPTVQLGKLIGNGKIEYSIINTVISANDKTSIASVLKGNQKAWEKEIEDFIAMTREVQ